jgi:tight adherence protein B
MTGNLSTLLAVGAIAVVAPLVAAACLLWFTPAPAARLRVVIEPTTEPTADAVAGPRSNWRQPNWQWASVRRPDAQVRVRAIAGVAATAALWGFAGSFLTVTVLVGVAIAAVLARRAKSRRDDAAIRQAVYELCRGIAVELRAGGTPAAAFRAAVAASPEPLRGELSHAAQFVTHAEPAEFADLLIGLRAVRPAFGGLASLAACWHVVVASGAMLAPAIDRVAEALRDEIDLEQALAISLAAPRATVRLLAGLPLLGLGLGAVIGAHPLAFLVGSPAGVCCFLLAAAFDAGGVAWARRIANRATRAGLRGGRVIGSRQTG